MVLKVGNKIIPLLEITGPLQASAQKGLKRSGSSYESSGSSCETGHASFAVGAAAGLFLGWYIDTRGRRGEKGKSSGRVRR